MPPASRVALAAAALLSVLATPLSAAAAAPIRVHVAPHTHNDVGWGESYLAYYYGTGPYGPQFRNATKIFSQVVAGLLADPARRFSYVEQVRARAIASDEPATVMRVRLRLTSPQLQCARGCASRARNCNACTRLTAIARSVLSNP